MPERTGGIAGVIDHYTSACCQRPPGLIPDGSAEGSPAVG
jgi:hypothetical protein